MKYLLLMWTEDVPEGQDYAEGFGTAADFQVWMDFESRLRESGAYVESGELEPARSAVVIRPSLAGSEADGEAASGATGSLKVSGFYLVDVPDEQAALALAGAMPLHGNVEVRALVDYGGADGGWDADSPESASS